MRLTKARFRAIFFAALIGSVTVLAFLVISMVHNKSKGISASANQQKKLIEVGSPGPYKYLPAAAGINGQAKDVVLADIDGDGQQEEIIFYSLSQEHKAAVLVLKLTGSDYSQLWEQVYDDSWGFYDLSGVYDLNKTGRPQIVAYRKIGASCPGVLEIYESRHGKIERITGAWADNGQCQAVEIKDLDGDGREELVMKIRRDGQETVDIYVWNGSRYVEENTRYSSYYNSQLTRLLSDIHSTMALPTSARVTWCKEAVRIYIIQRRYAKAILLSKEVLQMIDDPNLTKPNSIITGQESPEQRARMMPWFEQEKIDGKSEIHSLLKAVYEAEGDSRNARIEDQQAQMLKSAAEEMRSKLLTAQTP